MVYFSILAMTDSDILREIQDIKRGMGSFGDRLVRLRYLDLKNVFVEEMRQAMVEEGRRSFDQGMDVIGGTSDCPLKQQCTEQLSGAVESSISTFEKGDLPGAMDMLERARGLLCGEGSPCQNDACSRQAADTIRRVQTILSIYSRLSEDLSVREAEALPSLSAPKAPEGEAEDAEKVLAPLSNAWRIRTLRLLREGARGLSDLGKEMSMKTGHLNFHIKTLVEAGYVTTDRRSRLYSLTTKGRVALDCVDDMLAKLNSP